MSGIKDPHSYRIKLREEELNLFKKENVQKMLEVFCGKGENLIALEQLGFKVEGIESVKVYVNKAKEAINKENMDISVMHHPVFDSQMPYDNESFDCVYSYQYLNHNFKDAILNTFKDIYRILKKDGIFSITITDIEQFNLKHVEGMIYEECDPEFPQIRYRKFAEQTYAKLEGDEMWIPHYGFYEKELVEELEKIGFKLINIRKIKWNLIANFRK
jgi:SAM-dependent methyltransferase